MVSYRDPHLKETLDVYKSLPDYLRNFQADELEMTKYVIGTISELDTPLNASAKGALALMAYFTKATVEEFQKEREEILNTDVDSIRQLADLTQAILTEQALCVVGSECAIEKEADIFKVTEGLIQA